MKNVVVVGSQWGDEGKGKIVDWLSSEADIVVRFQGGHNAGHTLVIDKKVFKLRLLPSGIVRKEKISILGNGVVIDPWALLSEIEDINKQGIEVTPENFMISESASLILPFHQEMDEIREDAAGKEKIGTTRRGIGPCYEDKISRKGLRFQDLKNIDLFTKKLSNLMDYHNFLLEEYYNVKKIDKNQVSDEIITKYQQIKKYIIDTDEYINDLCRKGGVVFEGAQGTMLDIDHGTFPYVTSSNTTLSGVVSGTGVNMSLINYGLGITKAYSTRVGHGPFPSELNNDIGKKIGEIGGEIGATTGRTRRCGWLDLKVLKKAIRLNNLSGIALTKIDVLDHFDEISICTDYGEIDYETFNVEDIELIKLPGWKASTVGIKKYQDLPNNARSYIETIERLCNIPTDIISTGPARDEIIQRINILDD
jgi:adenylosuccinate synthase